MKKYLCIIILGALLASCSPRVIEHYQTVRDTAYFTHYERDSIFERDSIYIREKADTVYQYVERWRTRYIEHRDTVFQTVHDTTFVKETVENPLSPFQKAKIRSFWGLISIIAALLLWTFRKLILALIKG